jgi:hypothetical protein
VTQWLHVICEICWDVTHSNPKRTPMRLLRPEAAPCCMCGLMATDGILVRLDPAVTKCRGVHTQTTEAA